MLLVKHNYICVHTVALKNKHVSNRNTYSCCGWGSTFEEGDTICPVQCHLWNTMKNVVRGSRIGLYINMKESGSWDIGFMDFWNI